MRLSVLFVLSLGLLSLVETVSAVKGSRIRGVQASRYERDLQVEKKSDDDKDKDSSKDDGDSDVDTDTILDIVGDFGCFSEEATVWVRGKDNPVSMKELQVNNYVLVEDGTYHQVYAFGHRDVDKQAAFYQLHTSGSGKPLEVTGEHLVFLRGDHRPVRVDSIKVGDHLEGIGKEAKVVKVEKVEREGLYAPLTASGKIVVDDVLASAYISLQKGENMVNIHGNVLPLSQHDFIHMAVSPFRVVCQGVSSRVCGTDADTVMPAYISYGMRFIKWGEKQSLLLQMLLLGLALLVLAAVMLVENTLGASLAPNLTLFAMGVYFALKMTNVTVRATKAKAV